MNNYSKNFEKVIPDTFSSYDDNLQDESKFKQPFS